MDSDVESLGGAQRSPATGLDEVLVVVPVGDGPSSDACSSSALSRGEVRKSRSKMKNYLKRCKDALIGGVGGAQVGASDVAPSSAKPVDGQPREEVVVYHAHGGEPSQPSSTSCWYLDDQLMELHPEDNREPYSSLASARLKQELEEARLAREAVAEEGAGMSVSPVAVPTAVTSSTSSGTERTGECPGDNIPNRSVIEDSAGGNIAPETSADHIEMHSHCAPPGCSVVPSGAPASGSTLSSAHGGSIEDLIDRYLGPLYPHYADHTRPMLIRQARDLLVCTFHGDLERFEGHFLRPATDIVRELRCTYQRGKDLSWCEGWPLAVAGALVLHLGALDESLVRAHDTYLCIRPEPDTSKPELYAVWRGAPAPNSATPAEQRHQATAYGHHPPPTSVVYRRLDPIRDPITPLAVEMLTEDLPALLQNLLVGIERAISRVPLEDLSFPAPAQACPDAADPRPSAPTPDPSGADRAGTEPAPEASPTAADGHDGGKHATVSEPPGTPKLGLLKRRELITKNNKLLINSKYTQLHRRQQPPSSSSPSTTPATGGVSGANLSTAPSAAGGNQNPHGPRLVANGGKSENTPQINGGGNQRNDGLSVTICDTGGVEGGGGGGGGSGVGGAENGGDNRQSPSADIGSTMPLFCLGGSFPHIDSDEESSDDQKKCETAPHLPHEIVAPRSIRDLPEKLLSSGISIPGTHDRSGSPIIYIEVEKTLASGLNCYEIATVLLYYDTLPIQRPAHYTLHLLVRECAQLAFLETIESTLQLLDGHLKLAAIFVSGSYDVPEPAKELLRPGGIRIKYLNNETIKNFISTDNLPIQCCGFYVHDQREWVDFFQLLEPLQQQCVETGRRLVSVLGDLRTLEYQQQQQQQQQQQHQPQSLQPGTATTRRQLHSQHRALSRALMDSELQNLRRKGPSTIQRLQDKLPVINNRHTLKQTKNLVRAFSVDSNTRSVNGASTTTTTNSSSNGTANGTRVEQGQDIINARLAEVIAIYGEVDRAARKLEQLTEQRRERLREMTRQRALDDEINEVISWMRNEGEKSLRTYGDPASLECPDAAKESEQQFEQFYFIARKHLGKGRDLCDASGELESMRENLRLLKECADEFQERLERVRERIEGAARLHSLLAMQQLKLDEDIRTEMLKLAEKIEAPGPLVERCRRLLLPNPAAIDLANDLSTSSVSVCSSNGHNNHHNTTTSTSDNISLDISLSDETITATSTPEKGKFGQPQASRAISPALPPSSLPTLASEHGEPQHDHHHHLPHDHQQHQQQQQNHHMDHHHHQGAENGQTAMRHRRSQSHHHHHHHHHHHRHDEEDEELSKMADSGLGGCDRCEGNAKLERTCSCQSFDDPKNMCNNSDDLDEDCFEGISKPSLDLQIPLQANAHLYCHASNLQLDYEENNPFDQKTQKTLLLIMREMIGTERDYVRSLQYVIENYTQELLREDIPQALRGQRNVIFGNIERISEFHRQHFLSELESCEHHPLKVGSAFLRHESKFYLYALYNKNKPKSDSLMSENGTQFFKAKQIELNDKMDLASYLLKPVQRMGKYALLLQQLMKACADVQHTNSNPEMLEDLELLQKAEEMVRFQLRHGNDLLAMDSLRDCDVNVKEQGRLLRQNEFLVWEGKAGKKSLRQVFLFEELVLFSKARRFPDRKNLDIYIYKNSIKTSDIGLTAHVGDSPYRFEIWFRKRKPGDTWTLQTMSEDVKNAWTEEVSKLLWKQAKRNREIRLAEMSSMGIGSKPCLDIRPSQDQINDRSISISQLGKAPKLRNSFMGTLPESKSSKRPQSIISVSSSSSGSSSVSTGTSSTTSGCEATTVSVSGNSNSSSASSSAASNSGSASSASSTSATNSINTTTCKRLTLSITDPNAPAPLKTSYKKHQRSTTLVSQCSMESGIIADISLSPDEVLDGPHWPLHHHHHHLHHLHQPKHSTLKKSHSLASSAAGTNNTSSTTTTTTTTTTNNNRGPHSLSLDDAEDKSDLPAHTVGSKTNGASGEASSTTITVHL
uniref:DH domain-containing protein n=1 Tax=Anopheles atroparvus TaxID=41427 RepID=A0AAG5D9S6_ANOAO